MKAFTVLAALVALAAPVSAQGTSEDLSARLRAVLPAEVADRVIATVSEARNRGLPAHALEQRALMLAAKGVEASSIARSVADQSRAMGEARAALARGRADVATGDDIAAGAEVIRKGVDGAQVSELARSAPSGRSLAVPLFVLGSLVDRGLPSDVALAQVVERMNARATDAELAALPEQAVAGRARAVAGGRGAGAAGGTVRGGPPTNVPPVAGGGRGRPAGAGRP
ncbi:MAG: hypothetical protein WEA80_07175 [Gemmatimonadaceae bacterium]